MAYVFSDYTKISNHDHEGGYALLWLNGAMVQLGCY